MKENFSIRICSLLLMCLVGWAYPADCTQTKIWRTSTFDEFRSGDLNGVSLTFSGKLTLAPQPQQLLSLQGQDMFVWALAEDSQGNLYAGTGEQGRIYKISPEGEVQLFFDSPEIGIISLAIDDEDNVYAGSAPDGFIYKITPDGTQSTFFSTEQTYVWSLAFDDQSMLYAGTGETGKIFRIMPDGTGTVLYDSPQPHIMALLYDQQGWLYAGTEGQGVVYKIGMDGNAFALYSAEEEEIHTLALDSQGNLYAAALSNTFYLKAKAPGASEQTPSPQEKTQKSSSIYQITPAGSVTKLLELADVLIYAMIAEPDDHLLLGTDQEGRLYRVFSDGNYQHVTDVQAGSILALWQDAIGTVFLGTGDGGAVFRLSSMPGEQGTYLSPVYDATTISKWGKISWRNGSPQIKLATRTGNTPTPDDTWSAWTEDLQTSEGEPVLNPPARFMQWKATLSALPDQPSPVLEDVAVAYLPHNMAPEIRQIVIYYVGKNGDSNQTPRAPQPVIAISPQSEDSKPSQPEASKQNGLPKAPKHLPAGYFAVMWDADDPNNEELQYTLALRGAEESTWKILEEDLTKPAYLLDTFTLPDGEYYLKVIASDLPNNPPNRALQTEKVSERFEIDNTAPEISIALNQKQGNDTVFITVVAHDKFSHLQEAEYSVDTGEWTTIFPDDEITDSKDEKYSIKVHELPPGEHVLIFRATDRFGNIGLGKIQFSLSEKP